MASCWDVSGDLVITTEEISSSGQHAARSPAATTPAEGLIPAAPPPVHIVIDAAGFDLRPNPLEADTAAAFVVALRMYRIWAGRPSFRELARRTGGTPAASTICTMLRGQELPAFDCMLAYLRACGAAEEDLQRFATTWRRLSYSDDVPTRQIPASREAAEHLPDRQDQ